MTGGVLEPLGQSAALRFGRESGELGARDLKLADGLLAVDVEADRYSEIVGHLGSLYGFGLQFDGGAVNRAMPVVSSSYQLHPVGPRRPLDPQSRRRISSLVT